MPKKIPTGQEPKLPMFSVSCEESLYKDFQLKVAQENKSVSKKVREWIIQFLEVEKKYANS